MIDSLVGPIPGDPFVMAGALDFAALGYRREEWFVSGTARSYAPVGAREADGRWRARPDAEAPFTTRIVVVRPEKPATFDGTLVLEWMNVTGGLDAAPDWLFVHRHLMRQGSVWVGVSVQKAGIDGGGLVPGRPLKEADAERYAGLRHPGDAFAFDIFASIGHALRSSKEGPLADLDATCSIAMGESQSAAFLVTYLNAIDPLDPCFDAALVHGRPAGAPKLDGSYLRAARSDDLSKVEAHVLQGERIREDVRIPVLELQSETDLVVLGSVAARQPDGERFRLWEIAGASHFDAYGLVATHTDDGHQPAAELAARMAPSDKPMGIQAKHPINSGPQQHYIAQAALAHLERWARGGAPPPVAARLELRAGEPIEFATDELGNVRGGVRSPWVDVPTALLSGLSQAGEGFLFLFGTTRPFDAELLARLYPGGADEHRERFTQALEAAVDAGFVLEADREEILGLVRAGIQPSGFAPA